MLGATELYVLLLFILLLLLLAYNHLARLNWTEEDRRRADAARLNLLPLVRLLESPDTAHLLKQPETRKALFREYALAMRQDVMNLARKGQLRLSTLLLLAVFFLAYFLIWLKAKANCKRKDLLLLGRLELEILRSLAA